MLANFNLRHRPWNKKVLTITHLQEIWGFGTSVRRLYTAPSASTDTACLPSQHKLTFYSKCGFRINISKNLSNITYHCMDLTPSFSFIPCDTMIEPVPGLLIFWAFLDWSIWLFTEECYQWQWALRTGPIRLTTWFSGTCFRYSFPG